MNYTRGPWKSFSRCQDVTGPAGVTVAFCGDNGTYGKESYTIGKRESYENARLIAAAPEMLEALMKVYDNRGEADKLYIMADRLRPLIEKATGKTWEEIMEVEG